MSTLKFRVSQIADQIQFRGNPKDFKGSDAAWWSMPSYQVEDDRALANLKPDGGRWRGTAQVLPDGALNMQATWLPDENAADSVQFAGIVRKDQPVSAVAVVGGTGKFRGARGEAKSTVAMSDQDTPLFTYEITLLD
jgi:hypothetical protein